MSGNGKQRREKVHLPHDNPNVRVSGRRVVKESEKVLWKKEKPKPIPGSGTGRRIQYMPTEMDKKLAGAMKRKRDEEEEEEEAEDQEIDYEEEDDEEEEGLGAAPQPALVPRAAPPQAAQSAAGPSAGPRAQFSIRGSAVVTLAESFTGVSADNIHLVPRHSAAAGSRATEVRYTQFINRLQTDARIALDDMLIVNNLQHQEILNENERLRQQVQRLERENERMARELAEYQGPHDDGEDEYGEYDDLEGFEDDDVEYDNGDYDGGDGVDQASQTERPSRPYKSAYVEIATGPMD